MPRKRPGYYALRIQQRATFECLIQLYTDNTPVDLTGYSGVAQIFSDEKRTTKLIDITLAFTDRPNGKIKLSLTREQTRLLVKNGFWDLLIIEPGQNADYWLRGPAILETGLSDQP